MSLNEIKTQEQPDGTNGDVEPDHDPHFEPIVSLPEVEISTNEENEIELIKLRAKLFRFDNTDTDGPQWKERGTGEVKILQHKEKNTCRIVMRRDKTYKICANHFITPWMTLKPSNGTDRAWVWTVAADFADETAKSECLAIRFANASIANQWKEKFDEAQQIVAKSDLYCSEPPHHDSCTDSGQSSEDSETDSPKKTNTNIAKSTATTDKETTEEASKVVTKLSELSVTE